jgi:hypothetical protein
MYEHFDIYFSGELLEGADPAEVRRSLCRMHGIDEAKAIKLLSGLPVRVKRNVDVETAGKYRATFRRIGVLIDIRPCKLETTPDSSERPALSPEAERNQTAAKTTADAAHSGDDDPDPPPVAGISVVEDAELELLPANTGSLEDCVVPKSIPAPPDISGLAVDVPGGILDESPPPPPPSIDTSHLSAEPARVGSLEDCVVEKPIRRLPDVSHLRLLD